MYLKGEILHDAHVLEHSSFKCFQDGADNFFFVLYSENSLKVQVLI